MKTLPLSNSDEVTMVDDDQHEFLSQFKWRLKKSRCGWYVVTSIRYGKKKKKVATIRLHRLVAGCWDDMVVDHIDFNHLNNQYANLRVLTNTENAARNDPSLYKPKVYKETGDDIPF